MIFKKITFPIFLLVTIFASYSFANLDENEQVTSTEIKKEIIETNSNITKVPDINSRACVVIDRATKTILFGKNENDVRKMASTTKIMTAMIVIENTNLYDTVTVSKKAACTGGSRIGLKEGDKITVCDLLYGLLLKSGNDSAVALAEHTSGNIEDFSNLMNNKAQNLNLINTHFITPHGLDHDNHYTTAYELAILTDYALNNQIFKNIVSTQNYSITVNNIPKSISNTNELLGNLDGVYGVKTGFTNGANRCLVTSCSRNNLDIICVVLGADTKKFRTQDSIKLIEYVFNSFEMINLRELVYKDFNNWKQNNLSKFSISKGLPVQLELDLDGFNYELYPVKKDSIKNIHTSITCNNHLDAPLTLKSIIGKLDINIDNFTILKFNIVNTISINKKHSFNYMVDFLSNYFKYLTINF